MSVQNITVVGGGTMGNGIAHVAAQSGFNVTLVDVNDAVIERAMKTITSNLERQLKKETISEADMKATLGRISTSTSLEQGAANADLVIEAASERLEIKRQIFATLDAVCKPTAILASNTSSISITELAGGTKRADKFIGMHFFNPVPKMRLVEIVRTPHTSEETVATCVAVAHRMHKETVIVNEAPGFITSRINALIGNEAFAMLEAGVASAADIDKAIKLGLNHPMGPFEMIDLVGLDVRLKILEYLHATLGEKFRPSPLLRRYVQEGRLGRKSGRGVYDYSDHTKEKS